MYQKIMLMFVMLLLMLTVWNAKACAMPCFDFSFHLSDKPSNKEVDNHKETKRPAENVHADASGRDHGSRSCLVPGYPPDLCELCAKHTGSRTAYKECCRGSDEILEFCVDFLFYKFDPERPKR